MLRTAAAASLLVLTLLAGCTTRDAAPGPEPPAPQAFTRPYGTFLCKDGFREQVVGHFDVCNHRVTLPLVDGARFDWTTQHGPANEVSIAVSPQDPLVVAGGAKDYTVSAIGGEALCGQHTVWMGTYWSRDGGITWGNDLMPGFPGDERPSPLRGNHCNTDPVVVFDDDGTLFFSGLNYGGARDDLATVPSRGGDDAASGSQIYFARSHDGGATYGEMTFVAAGDNDVLFHDKQWFAAQPGGNHMIVAWSPIPAIINTIMYAESLDAGATWTPPMQFVAGPGGAPVISQFAMPQYLANGNIAFIFYNFNRDILQYGEGILTPAGMRPLPMLSSFPVQATSGSAPSAFRTGTSPILATDTTGTCAGRRYVAYEGEGADGTVDVLLHHSDDGLTWTGPIVVNDGPGDQFMPWIDVDPHGGVHLVWYDKRNDARDVMMDVYHAYSDTCGQDFHPNVRVTELAFDGDRGYHQNGNAFIGDYIAVDAGMEAAYIMWSDTRHTGSAGRPAGSDVYAATLLRDADAAAAFSGVVRPSS